MSLEHFDDKRKAMSRRAKEMAKAARVVGASVRNMFMYDKDQNKKVELAKLLALNVQQPGAFGYFLGELRMPTASGERAKSSGRAG